MVDDAVSVMRWLEMIADVMRWSEMIAVSRKATLVGETVWIVGAFLYGST